MVILITTRELLPLLDPEPPRWPTGLQEGRCVTCGGRALVDAAYADVVRCSACWARYHRAPESGVVAARHERRFPGGRTAPAAANRELDRTGVVVQSSARPDHRRPRTGAASAGYRVLIPGAGRTTPTATPGQIPTGAAALLAAARAAGREARPTYSLAEELATGRLVHTVAVRVAGLGYAVWTGGGFTGARMAGRSVNVGEALALAAGTPYTPPAPRAVPPTGPCPRCGAVVRWRVEQGVPLPWKHKRAELGAEGGGKAVKVTCE